VERSGFGATTFGGAPAETGATCPVSLARNETSSTLPRPLCDATPVYVGVHE
jgi:hypothetical protein